MSNVEELPARVRAVNGQSRSDAWIQRRALSLRQRLVEAGRLVALGLLVGGGLLFIPLVHLFGLIFALTLSGLAAIRLRAAAVLEAAGGTCPRCGQPGTFFVGFGRRRFQWPVKATCGACGVELMLSHGAAYGAVQEA